MNTQANAAGIPENNDMTDRDFDERLRRMHAQALEEVSPGTRVQLAAPRPPAARRRVPSRAPLWALASACALAALAVGLRLLAPPVPTPPATFTDASDSGAYEDAYAVFDESPDLYLWLESDAATLLME